jgi:hypothetical protein
VKVYKSSLAFEERNFPKLIEEKESVQNTLLE